MKSLKLTRKHKILLSALEKNPQPLSKLDDKTKELAQQLLRAGFLEEAGGKLKAAPKPVVEGTEPAEDIEPAAEPEPTPRGEPAKVAAVDEASFTAQSDERTMQAPQRVAVLAPKEGAMTHQTPSFVPVYDQAVAKQPPKPYERHRTERQAAPQQRTTWTPGGRR